MSIIVNGQVVDKVPDDHGQQKKIARKLPNPQPITQRPKWTCRKSVFTISPCVTENKSKRNDEGGPTKEPDGEETDNMANEDNSQPSFDIGIWVSSIY